MKDKDLLKLLKQNGWIVKRIKGSHHILQKGDKKDRAKIALTFLFIKGGIYYVIYLPCYFS